MKVLHDRERIRRDIEKLKDSDLCQEFSNAKNLVLWAFRNDEGIRHDALYKSFHLRLAALKQEYLRRQLDKRHL